MKHFTHLTGVYEYDQTIKSVEPLPENPEFSEGDHHVMQLLRTADLTKLREANIILTKQQLRASIKPDAFIVNTINNIEEIDKVSNALVKRLREWYALYDPELEHAYSDHRAFVDAILTRTSERASDTMGTELAEIDLNTITSEAKAVQQLYQQRDQLLDYLELTMQQHAPNIKALGSAMIGAKLIALAGTLERLSRLPSSTIQLLGAETALFRHLRNKKARPPKHGIIFNHILLQRAKREMRGKIARALADKLSIAAKMDYFKGEFIGDKLYAQVEQKLTNS